MMGTVNRKSILLKLIPLIFLVLTYFVLYKIYIPRVNAFGCFDDCNNFMGGYFLLQGKRIFADFFYNHQPLATYISYFIQLISNPQNIFELVLRHRQFIILFSFVFNAILIFRFGIKVFLFIILFEFSKFYLFGDRFLSEGMIVYPLVYLTGLVLLKLNKDKLYKIDYIFSALFSWFVIFSREPYIPLTLFIFTTFILEKPIKYLSKIAIFLLVALSLLTLAIHNIPEYFFNVVTVNFQAVLPAEVSSGSFVSELDKIFLYPVYVLLLGPFNIFKSLLAGISFAFIILFTHLIYKKSYLLALFIFLLLGVSNIRLIAPGTLFYSAFHMLVWYGLFIFITVLLLFKEKNNKFIFLMSAIFILISFFQFILSLSYFAREKINPHAEFITNYGSYLQEGEVIKILSNPSDTLFLDVSDDLVYWQAKRDSSYKYSWYTSAMVYFPKYFNERIGMFKSNPPLFYREYGSCPKEKQIDNLSLPEFVKSDYVNLLKDGEQSCLYVHKDKLRSISQKQWDEAEKWHFSPPVD